MTGSGEDVETGDPDFFVSYTHSDERWAEWISWVLEDAGHRVVIQAWDFGAGSHFVAEMHQNDTTRGPDDRRAVGRVSAWIHR